MSTDVPAPADYDGDGKADYTVWRDSDHTFYSVRSSNTSYQYAAFTGISGKPVPGDYDGDGKANYALRSGASWIIMNAAMTATTTTTPTGNGATDLASDIPVQNDYDGDGKCDIAVWRPVNTTSTSNDVGNWYIRNSATSTTRAEHWGQFEDIPVPAFYRR